MITEELFNELQELYKNNVALFKQQNTGFLVDQVYPLHIEDVAKAIDVADERIDKKYVQTHFVNFTINPQVYNVREGYATQVDIMPDISWEAKK